MAFAERANATVHGPRATARIGRLDAEYANLRAALEWSVEQGHGESALRLGGALQDFWYLRGHLGEGRRWLEEAVALGTAAPADRRASALLGLGWLAHFQGDAERAADALGQSLGLYRELGDRLGTGIALDLLGILDEDQGAYDAVAPLFAEARACFEEVGNRSLVSQAAYHLGLVALGQGDLDRATERFAEAERLARAEGDDFNLASALCYHGLVHCARGALARAADALEEALALDQAAGNREGVTTDLASLAVLSAAAGRPDAAVRLLGAAGGLRDRLGLRPFAFPERVAYDGALDASRGLLGERAFAAAWAEGWARTRDEQSAADIEAVLAAARSPSVAARSPNPARAHGFTPREVDVLRLLVAGRSNPEIAAALFISPRTATTHVTNILAKLGVESRTEAAARAVRDGLCE